MRKRKKGPYCVRLVNNRILLIFLHNLTSIVLMSSGRLWGRGRFWGWSLLGGRGVVISRGSISLRLLDSCVLVSIRTHRVGCRRSCFIRLFEFFLLSMLGLFFSFLFWLLAFGFAVFLYWRVSIVELCFFPCNRSFGFLDLSIYGFLVFLS